jgi:tetratricopeptide (TPR) repeat protein
MDMESIKKLMDGILSHYEKKEYAAAMELVDDLLAMEPTYQKAWFLRGAILEETGKRAEAEKQYEKAGDLFTMWIRTAMQLQEVDPERALVYYGRVIESDPTFNPALLNKGLICEKMGKLDEARACFRRLSPGKELFSKVVTPTGFMALLLGSGLMLVHRGDWVIAMFSFVSALVCFFWLKRDAGMAIKMLTKKMKYK